MSRLSEIKHQIHNLIQEYYEEAFSNKTFVPGESSVPVSGKVFDHRELQFITDSALDAWFTAGKFNTEVGRKVARDINIKAVIKFDSSSSSHLIAFSVLT